MTTFRRFLSIASATFLAASVFLCASTASATNYAVCVGVNEYKISYCGTNNWLNGSVPDARHMTNLITSRGEWSAGNVTILTDSAATLTKIRQAVSNCAAQAQSGDHFLYYHSSHGGNDNYYFTTNSGKVYLHYSLDPNGIKNYICSYNEDYTAKDMATDLAAFPAGVKIVVMMDTCHSSGMFKYNATTSSKKALAARLAEATPDESPDGDGDAEVPPPENSVPGFFMTAVLNQLQEAEAEQVRRGLRPRSASSLATDVGWIAAADYDQYSWDGNNGGAFTEAFINGVTNQNKMCDNATYGNQDGYASFYEGWNYAKDIAQGYRNYDAWEYDDDYGYYDYIWTDAQCTNTAVLSSVLVGWAGKTAPANVAPSFSPSSVTTNIVQNHTLSFPFSATGTPVPSYTLSTSVSSSLYTFTGNTLSFTPTATGTYTFTCTASNTSGTATCTLTVTVTPAPPETPSEVTTDSSDSFTATWSPVTGATGYELLVIEGAAAGSGETITETFANASFSTTGSSYANQTISGCDLGTWTATQCRGDYDTPVVKAAGTLTSPAITGGVASVEFDYVWPFSSDSSGTCGIDLYVGGTYKGSATVTAGTSGTASYTSFESVSGTPTIMFTNTATSNKRIRMTEVRITTAGSRAKALPRAVGDVVYSNSVGNVTNFTVAGLQPETAYSYTVRAIVNGQPTGWSDSVSVTTAEGDSAPSISVEQTSYAVTVGDPDVNFTITVTGSPTPTVTHSCTEGAYYVFEDGEFVFEANTVGTYHFVFTATNTEGSDTVTVTVAVSAAPVTVPTLTVSDVDSTSATASWTACDGVSAYTLQLASDNQFTTGGSGGGASVELVNEGFDNGTTLPSGWTVESGSISGTYTSGGNYGASSPSLQFKNSVTLSTPTLSNPTNVSFWYKGQGSGLTSTLEIQQLLGGTWTNVDTLTITGTGTTLSYPLDSSATQVRFIFTKASGNLSFDDVVITGTSGSSGSSTGSLISSETVSGLSHTFTGLTPETTYYARVKGTSDWSNVETFTTQVGADSAPVWSALPTGETAYVGELYDITLTGYVTASPAATITLVSATADGVAYSAYEYDGSTLVFSPEAQVAYVFNFSAANGVGQAATATLTVTGVADAATLSIPSSSLTATVGELCTFNATFGGRPTPTFSVTSDYPDASLYSVSTNGVFEFIPAVTGDYSFTLTAANIAATVSQQFTVAISAAPVTVPTLTVSDVAATTAVASWTECTGVTEYTLQLASDNQFTTGGSGAAVLEADFSDTSDWTLSGTTTYVNSPLYGNSSPALAFKKTGNYAISPVFSGGTKLTFWAYGNGTGTASTFAISRLVDGDWTEIETVSIAIDADTYEVNLPSGTTQLRFDFTKNGYNCALDDVVVTGASGSGSLISETSVSGLTSTFTGLTPETTYYARVMGDADWSTPVEFTTQSAADSAPVWSAIPAISVTVGEYIPEFHPANYVSGTPAPTITLSETTATSGDYLFDNGLLTFQPNTLGSFTFTFLASNSLGTATGTLTVNSTGTPPAIAPISNVTTGLNETVMFLVTATGTPEPSFSVTGSGIGLDPSDYSMTPAGVFDFTPSALGTYTFTVTATSLAGTDTATFTVTAITTVPELTVTNVTTTTAVASWTACDGVTSYTLQLTDEDFPAASSASARGVTTLLSETFADAKGMPTTAISNFDSITDNDGWEGSYVYAHNETVRISSGSYSGDIESPWLTNATAGATVTLAFDSLSWTNAYTTVNVTITEDGSTYSDPISFSLTESMATYTTNFTVSGTRFRVNWAPSAAKKRFFLDNVRITTPESSGGDDPGDGSIQEFTVTGTSHTFTNLTPTTYYLARVKGNAGWSQEILFMTLSTSDTAPTIDPIADQTYTYGDNDGEFTLTVTASGTPSPTLTVTSDDAIGLFDIDADGEFLFIPTAVGTFHFTVTAANGVSPNATESFAVTVTGTAPTLAAIADQTVSVEAGQLTVPLTVAGNPAPTVTVASADAPEGLFEINADGNFYFVFAEAGTFHFTVTAANGVSPDATQSFAVTVTGGETPLTDYQQWLQDHGVATDTSATADAPNGHTYGECYAADIDPSSAQWLTIAIASTNFTFAPSSTNRYYQLLYTTDLSTGIYQTNNLGQGATSGTFPDVEGDWYGGLRVTPTNPNP